MLFAPLTPCEPQMTAIVTETEDIRPQWDQEQFSCHTSRPDVSRLLRRKPARCVTQLSRPDERLACIPWQIRNTAPTERGTSDGQAEFHRHWSGEMWDH